MLRRWILITAFTVMACIAASVAWSAVQARPKVQPVSDQPGPLIVISVRGLTLTDGPDARTSALWDLAREGAVGAMTTRGMSDHSCSPHSWLSLSAGVRTTLWKSVRATPPGEPTEPCPVTPAPETYPDGSANFPDWPSWRRATLARQQPAPIGAVGSLFSQSTSGRCIAAGGRDAALGAADRNGVVGHYSPDPRAVDINRCNITFISLDRPDDTFLRRILDSAPPRSTIVVGSFGDDAGPERLHPVVVVGPGVQHGLLTSASTRQRGIVQLTDLSAFIFSRAGDKAPNLPEGRNLLVQPSGSPTAPVLRTAELSHALHVEHATVRDFVIGFYVVIVVLLAAGYAMVLAARGRDKLRAAAHQFVAFVAATAVAMPVSTFLVNAYPWWRHDRPRLFLVGGVVFIAVILAAVALLGPWRRWLGGSTAALCLITGTVIALDVTHGDDLQLLSMFGLQPVYGGRFFGMGNVGFAFFATAALLFAAIVASPLTRHDEGRHGLAALTVALVGVAAIVVDGYPGWGAEAGGPIAMLPAFAYLTINAAGLRLTWLRFLIISAAAGLVVAGMAALDYLRGPAERTHLGDFFAQAVMNGNFSRAERVWQANWNMLTESPLSLLVPLIPLLLSYVLLRPQTPLGAPLRPIFAHLPVLQNGMAAVTVCWIIGFAVNDSGTGIPAAGLMLLAPLVVMQRARIAAISRSAGEPRTQR